jgi:hypothetical protein
LSPVAAPCEIELLDLDLDPGEVLASPDHERAQVAAKRSRAVRFTPEPMAAVDPSSSVEVATTAAEPEPAPDGPVSAQPVSMPGVSASSGEPEGAAAASEGTTRFDPRPGIMAFAGFGLVPEKLSEMPAYTLHVLARRRVLRAGLEVARARRPQDVELYQAALTAADRVAYRKGLMLLAVMASAVIGVIAALLGLLVF